MKYYIEEIVKRMMNDSICGIPDDSKKFAISNTNTKFVDMEKVKEINISIPKIKECKPISTINNPETPCIIP